jgi:hypothetical protein
MIGVVLTWPCLTRGFKSLTGRLAAAGTSSLGRPAWHARRQIANGSQREPGAGHLHPSTAAQSLLPSVRQTVGVGDATVRRSAAQEERPCEEASQPPSSSDVGH